MAFLNHPCRWIAVIIAVAALGAGEPDPGGRHRAPTRPESSDRPSTSASSPSSSGWWAGSAGIGLAFCVVGGLAIASRRFLPEREVPAGALRIVGRISVAPRQAVCLVRVGDRTLIVGTGGSGPPALLGEWAEGTPPARPTPGRSAPVVVSRPGGFDQRIGDDE